MNSRKHLLILSFITLTIIATVGIQFYWNHKNYEQNKQRVINEIQQSLNDAVNNYFTDLSKDKFYAIVKGKDANKNTDSNIFSSFFGGFNKKNKNTKKKLTNNDSISFKIENISFTSNDENQIKSIDSSFRKSLKLETDIDTKNSNITIRKEIQGKNSHKTTVFRGKKATDSLKVLKKLETIFISIQSDTIDIKKLDSLVFNQLKSKKIQTNFSLKHFKSDTLFNTLTSKNNKLLFLETNAQTSF